MRELLVLWHRWLPRRAGGPEAHAELASWRRTVAARLAVGGGEVVAQIGGSVVAVFEPAEAPDVLEMGLDLLEEAESSGIDVALAAALGPVEVLEDGLVGEAFERAQQLANRARLGELVLDASVREAVREAFLFGRQVAGAWRGTTVDRANPRRVETADAIGELAAPTFPPVGASLVAEVSMHLDAGTSRTFLLRGPVGAGAGEIVGLLGRERGEAPFFEIGASPGGLVPLGSLRLALLRAYGTPEEGTRAALDGGVPAAEADRLGAVSAGELVPCGPLAGAVAALLESHAAHPWVMLSPLSQVDAATLAVLLRARETCDFVIFGRLPTEAALPSPLASLDERVVEHVIPPLKTSDARFVAEQILGRDTDPEVARKVAVLGGDTVIGVVEAARTLIATGEVVRGEGEGFVWRAGPREGVDMISTEELLSERIELLDPEARQVLEALAVAPDGASRGLLEAVAGRDAIGPATFDQSLERLLREGFARDAERPRPTSSLLRWRVLELTPAARSMELHRFFGEALAAQPCDHAPQIAELGYYLVEGGRHDEGHERIAAILEELVEADYRRAARHLSSWLASFETESAEGAAARPTPVPPPAEAHDEAPPSSEVALGEFLDDGPEEPAEPAPEVAAEAPPPPPAFLPRRPLPPVPAREEVLELSEDEVELIEEPVEEGSGPLELDMEGLSSRPDQTLDLEVPDDRTAEHLEVPAAVVASTPGAPEEPFDLDDDGAWLAPPHEDEGEGWREIPAASPEAEAAAAAAHEDEEEDYEPEPDSDETVLSDAAELMAAFRAHQAAPTVVGTEAPSTVEIEAPSGSGEAQVEGEPRFVVEATRLLRAGRFDELEQAIQRAIAEGADLGAVGRFRAMAQLARGELSQAKASLDEARERGRDDRSARGRYALAMALLSLKSGDAVEGVRQGLSALACARDLVDARGEAAALKTLAACYRALGRDDDAQRMDRA